MSGGWGEGGGQRGGALMRGGPVSEDEEKDPGTQEETGRSKTEMPTSTFLPYFVRFLKENTAVRFSRQNTFFFYFFFLLESESSTLHTLFML